VAKEFNFQIMVCSQNAKAAAFETTGYLYTLLDTTPEYESKASNWSNAKMLLKLALPEPPWRGPPVSCCFGVTWGVVKRLLTGQLSIASLKLKDGR